MANVKNKLLIEVNYYIFQDFWLKIPIWYSSISIISYNNMLIYV